MFPKGPARAGEFDLEGKQVALRLQPETKATIEGRPVSVAKLEADTSERLKRVEMGSLRFHVIIRG